MVVFLSKIINILAVTSSPMLSPIPGKENLDAKNREGSVPRTRDNENRSPYCM